MKYRRKGIIIQTLFNKRKSREDINTYDTLNTFKQKKRKITIYRIKELRLHKHERDEGVYKLFKSIIIYCMI